MPSKSVIELPEHDRGVCLRCGAVAVIQARSEQFCKECFQSYVQSKAVKRMDAFRLKNAKSDERRQLLLAMSFGLSSLTLLYTLHQHIERQLNRSGRASYDLHVLHVINGDDASSDEYLAILKKRFPRFQYSNISLECDDEESEIPATEESLSDLIKKVPSATSRVDLLQIHTAKRVTNFAKSAGCEAVLWGHTTTALAERVLAETAKGRGFAVPWLLNDGASPLGVSCHCPMRDVLKKEVQLFAKLTDPPLTELYPQLQNKPAISSRTTTIDSLMKDYFASVEEDYPSIVANVVRTSGKLSKTEEGTASCTLCKMPFTSSSGWKVDNKGGIPASTVEAEAPPLCHGCSSTVRGLNTSRMPRG